MSTRQQTRAIDSHRLVEQASRNESGWEKYRTFCMKGPTLIQQSGLIQTTVFCASREDEGARKWIADVATIMGKQKLDDLARRAPLADYLALTRDALDAAIWLRRYAMAENERRKAEGQS